MRPFRCNERCEQQGDEEWECGVHLQIGICFYKGFYRRVGPIGFEGVQLWCVWEEVEKNLAYPWVLAELAKIAHLSPEHLRRLSQKQLGRSPVQQVTYLRVRRAVDLLTSTHDKVETIALAVGYESPFTFSNAFKRWTGRRPSDYREGR